MKIGQTNTHFSRVEKAILFLMRAFIGLFCMVTFGFTSNHGFPQTTVDIDADATMTVFEVFDLIQDQTEYYFIYKKEPLKGLSPIAVKKGRIKVSELLGNTLSLSKYTYKVKPDKTIIISRKKHAETGATSTEIQQLRVSGTVTAAPDNTPLPGVNIIVKGTSRGTMSDADGNYDITVEDTDVLIFSFIGYKTVEFPVNGREILDVEMEDDVTALQEVEVNAGYYTIKERNRTGNIAKVTAEEIQHQPVTSPLMALQGRVAGLEISPASGTPGVAPRIRIRGENSLRVDDKFVSTVQTEGGQPLYVIDGIPLNSNPISTGLNAEASVLGGGLDPLSSINPENIASIEVLKDADATSIYGSRGANGVILITTKRGTGTKESKTDLNISMYKGIGKLSGSIEQLNTTQYLEMRKEAFDNDSSTPFELNAPDLLLWDQNRYTDWQKVLLGGTSDITDIQGSVSGGNSNTFYRMGGSFHKETLIFPGNFGYKRVTGNLSINHRSTDQRFRASISVNYSVGKHNVYRGNLVSAALTLAPNAPKLYDENGELNWEINPNLGRPTWDNPLASLRQSHTSDNRNLIANGNLSYAILNGLNAKVNLGYTELNIKEIIQTPLISMRPDRRFDPETNSGTKPSADFNTNYRRSILIEPQLNYQKKWGEHAFDILAGVTYQENNDDRAQLSGEEYASDAFLGSIQGAEVVRFIDSYNEYKYNAIFGRIGYIYKDRYLLNLTGRRDGSSRFGPGNRFGNFGALGVAWIFSEEPWIKKHIPVLSFGKVRGSYGTTGNDQVGDYQFLDLYRFNTRNYQNATSLSPSALFNPNYYWERTKKLEAAIEIGLVQNRISLEASWFRNRSSNQLIQRALPATTGFNSVNDNFSEAIVENSGWEFVLRGNILRSDMLRWTVSGNFTVSRNKLVKFPGIEDTPYAKIFKVDEPLSIQRLYTWQGVNPETGEHEFVDVNEDGVMNDDDRQFSNALDRDFYGGINNTFRYKGLELSFLFQFSRQNATYLTSRMPGLQYNQPLNVLQRWQNEGDVTDVQRYSAGRLNSTYFRFRQSDANIENASFIRLKTLSLAYRFPRQLIKQIGLKQAKLFIQGQNLLTITGYSGLDPETGFGTPPLRMITSGIQLQF